MQKRALGKSDLEVSARANDGPLEPVSGALGVPVRVLAGVLSAVALIPTLLWLFIELL